MLLHLITADNIVQIGALAVVLTGFLYLLKRQSNTEDQLLAHVLNSRNQTQELKAVDAKQQVQIDTIKQKVDC